jgi:RNA polymerase sigma factor (sigma-70 family)
MAHAAFDTLLRYLRRLHNAAAETSDGDLLRHYVVNRDEAAFAALLRRHAPMVWGVCRRLLDNEQDAEDAFQAVFLVLLRKAASLRVGNSLANWLHAVTWRIARKARVTIRRQRLREAQAEAPAPSDPFAAVERRDLRALLDEELDRLPEKYRAPLVLCYLEGMSYTEAARQLSWKEGTVSGRLARARELLRQRLIRRGLTLSGAALTAALSESASAPAAAMTAAARMATLFALGQAAGSTAVSPSVATLTQASLQAMTLAKVKTMAVLAAVFCLVAGGGGLAAHRIWTAKESPPERTETPPAIAKEAEQPRKESLTRTDRYGDPLPPGALARIGTVRFRERDAIFALAYSPDGKMLASATGNRESVVRLWDAVTGKQLFLLPQNSGQICSLAFSPNGKQLASMGGGKGDRSRGLHLWNTATGKEILALQDRQASGRTVAFSPDGRQLATGGAGNPIRLWDIASGKQLLQFEDRKGTIWSCAFSPDGKTLATANHAGAICLWDAATGKELRRMIPPKILPKTYGSYVAFSSDGKIVASGGYDGSVYLWDAATGRERLTIRGRDKWQNHPGFSREGPAVVAFSPDGKYVAAGNEGIVYDAATGKERCQLQDFHRWVRALVFSPDGKTLAGESSNRIRFWDAATGKEIFKDAAHRDSVCSAVFSADGKTLFTASRDDSVAAWETATGRERFRFQGQKQPEGHQNEIALAPDGKTAAAWLAGALYSWDVPKPDVVRNYSGAAGFGFLHGIAFSPQGQLLAAVWKREENGIRLWAEGIAKEPRLLKGHQGGSNGLIFSADGKTLASGSSQGTADLWDVAAGQHLRTLPGFNRAGRRRDGSAYIAVFSLAFSPDGKILALGGSDGAIELWDTAAAREPRRLEPSPNQGWTEALAFAPDGKTLTAGYEDGTLRFWETATGKLRRQWATHIGDILALAFSPDGRLLASAGSDTTVLIWTADAESEPRVLSVKELEMLWTELASDDAAKAYRAISVLRAAAQQSVPFLKSRLRPIPAIDAKHLAQRITDLDDGQFAVREKASSELAKYGDRAESALRKKLEGKPPLEARRRIEAILEVLNRPLAAEQLRDVRAVEVLEHIGMRPARELLQVLAQGAAGARLTREAKSASERLTSQSSPRR